MDWLDRLQGRIVALDTPPVIYFLEEHPRLLRVVRPFFEAADRGRFTVVTSTLTLLEVLVQPLRKGDVELVRQYRSILLGARGLVTVPVSHEVAEEAARLEPCMDSRTPDAIHLATALREKANFLLTNDTRWPRLPSIEMLILDELASAL